jgi:hypothetical protein
MLNMSSLKSLPQSARYGANTFYKTAMNHPKTSSAVVLGTSVAAALVWAVRRNGGFHNLRRQILTRVRGR